MTQLQLHFIIVIQISFSLSRDRESLRISQLIRRVSFYRAIVGAPEAETPQTGVYRGGAVYKCDIAADDRCTLIHFDNKGKILLLSLGHSFFTFTA